MGPEISARERSKIIKKAKAITGYYSSSRKLRDEAIRDLFTALLSMKDASEYTLKSHEEHKLYNTRMVDSLSRS